MKDLTKSPCPITRVAAILSDTWTMLIMHNLTDAPKRFCELEEALNGISTRTLTNRLKKLCEDGLIEKTDQGKYRATKKGAGLKIIERAMQTYSAKYLV